MLNYLQDFTRIIFLSNDSLQADIQRIQLLQKVNLRIISSKMKNKTKRTKKKSFFFVFLHHNHLYEFLFICSFFFLLFFNEHLGIWTGKNKI